MVRAEPGSTKALANKMKAKGLQRLRWYCQACQRQMRDENGFKQHTMSEGHVRAMQLIGEDPKKYIRQYSEQFKRDFLLLLRTAHGEKPVHLNRFYQEYIANKEHIHMNATLWTSLTEFAKHLGRDGIVRVTEEEGKGVFISWIDNSPEALRRQDALRKKERQDRGDEEREKKAIQEQVERAHRENKALMQDDEANRALERREGEKVTLQFGAKQDTHTTTNALGSCAAEDQVELIDSASTSTDKPSNTAKLSGALGGHVAPTKLSFSSAASKPKNVFASAKKKATGTKEVPKKMSEAERIMREEIERKRKAEQQGGGVKKMKFNIQT